MFVQLNCVLHPKHVFFDLTMTVLDVCCAHFRYFHARDSDCAVLMLFSDVIFAFFGTCCGCVLFFIHFLFFRFSDIVARSAHRFLFFLLFRDLNILFVVRVVVVS